MKGGARPVFADAMREPQPAPFSFDARSMLVDRLRALWWVVIFEAAPEAWAAAEQRRMLAELAAMDGTNPAPRGD